MLWLSVTGRRNPQTHREISVFPGKSLSPIVNVVVGGEAVLVPEAPNAS